MSAADELTSNNISNCKQLKYVLDTLILFKEIPRHNYHKYKYIGTSDWGEAGEHDLDDNKRYYIGNIDKNRFGAKTKVLFELDLDTNEWYEVGEVIRK